MTVLSQFGCAAVQLAEHHQIKGQGAECREKGGHDAQQQLEWCTEVGRGCCIAHGAVPASAAANCIQLILA